MKFEKRTTTPTTDNKYYNSKINPFVSAGYGIFQNNGNCTAYAYGRYMEEQNIDKVKLSTANAENWFDYADNHKRGNVPKVGAIMCWRSGKAHYGADGAGHVAIVEEVKSNGDVLVSESAYGKYIFRNSIYTKSKNYLDHVSSKCVFQGFIYTDVDFDNNPTPTPEPTPQPIDDKEYYTIQKGDTLSKIAKKYKTTVKHLMELNPKIKDKNKIYAGDTIRVK